MDVGAGGGCTGGTGTVAGGVEGGIMSDAVQVVVQEGRAFAERHPELDATQASIGALTWGLLRAVAECPHCPGVFRTWHYDAENNELWHCSSCDRWWQYVPPVG